MTRRSGRRTALVAALATAAGLALAPQPVGAVGPGRELRFTFERAALLAQSGNADLRVRELTARGGDIDRVSGQPGGRAARFPRYRQSDAPVAVISVVDESGGDDLAPGSRDFTFGADFALDRTSQGSSTDNGNNLVQRGLYNDPMQYKIELDGRQPRCRVKGSAGAVLVRSSLRVSPDVWYDVRCSRAGSRVVLEVTRLSNGRTWRDARSGSIGSLQISRTVPLSVGGKLAHATRIAGSSDQFNGRVDNVFLNVK